MQTIKKVFRNSYSGEDIFSSATYKDGSWQYEKEFVAKSLQNQGFGKKAIVIGNGLSRLDFDLKEFTKSYVKTRLQTYGCNALYRDFAPDFLVATRHDVVNELIGKKYHNNHVVYASSVEILRNPGAFHLIPQDPSWNSGALATYLACFDGHPTVYLLGFDGIDTENYNNNVYADTNGYELTNVNKNDNYTALSVANVFKTYPLVDFVLVNKTGRGYMPDEWQGHTNLRRISFRELVLECDL